MCSRTDSRSISAALSRTLAIDSRPVGYSTYTRSKRRYSKITIKISNHSSTTKRVTHHLLRKSGYWIRCWFRGYSSLGISIAGVIMSISLGGMESTTWNVLMILFLLMVGIKSQYGGWVIIVRGSCCCSRRGLKRKGVSVVSCMHNLLSSCMHLDSLGTLRRTSRSNLIFLKNKTLNLS